MIAFYDPGIFPIGSKLLFVDPAVVAELRGNIAVSDNMLGSGFNIYLSNFSDADNAKKDLLQLLKKNHLDSYWNVESFSDFEFSRPILQQLKSDKLLFTLITVIILIVACSNIISMLILLVNDKRKEIGIMQSMGVSTRRIGTIFGLCGLIIGVTSSILGTFAAYVTLRNLQSLADFLSFLQGHDAFNAMYYGSKLPNEMSAGALFFVLAATMLISLLAGLIPAMKASKIRPSEILRSE